jgi:predicted DNA-binding transcriptional regulator AlpA
MNLLNTVQLSKKLGMSTGGLHQLRKRETSFPEPIKVSPKILRWDETDIENWLNGKKKETTHGESVGA